MNRDERPACFFKLFGVDADIVAQNPTFVLCPPIAQFVELDVPQGYRRLT